MAIFVRLTYRDSTFYVNTDFIVRIRAMGGCSELDMAHGPKLSADSTPWEIVQDIKAVRYEDKT